MPDSTPSSQDDDRIKYQRQTILTSERLETHLTEKGRVLAGDLPKRAERVLS